MAQLRLPRNGSQPELFRPTSTWTPYLGPLPRLSGVQVGIDTETRDDGLSHSRGPGWVYNAGYLCGVSVAWGDQKLYIPVRHPDTENRPVDEVIAWIEDIMRNCEVVFFNMGYDMGWLRSAGLIVWPERAHDAYVMSVLLDENHDNYSLDACCAREGVPGKDEAALFEAARAYGVDPKSGMWQLPARYVGAYAEQDPKSTLDLAKSLWPKIEEQKLQSAYEDEIALIPVIYKMRLDGIRISTSAVEKARELTRSRRDATLSELSRKCGRKLTIAHMRSPDALGPLLDSENIAYPRTPKTKKPSIVKEWLETQDHWLTDAIRAARQLDDLAEKFLGNYILGFEHRGRIHAEVHQLRDSEGGTRSFRLSYSSPPLQQMPARYDEDDLQAKEAVRAIRRAFLAERGDLWSACDYSQQEPRLAVHYSSVCGIIGAEEAVRYYTEVEDADFHTMTAKMAGITRKQAKIINLGLMYGMGMAKLARSLGLTEVDATDLLNKYHEKVPWVRGLSQYCTRMTNNRGYLMMLGGCRSHFDEWEPAHGRGSIPLRREKADLEWPGMRLKRAHTKDAMNRLIQGSAARQTKKAMIAMHRERINIKIQMHDELGTSVGSAAEARKCGEIMRDVVRLRIPIKVDVEVGPNWGDAMMTPEEAFS